MSYYTSYSESNVPEMKVGDPVIISGRGHYSKYRVDEVERLTKTLIITKGGSRFRKQDGRESGCTEWDWETLYVSCEGLREIVKRQNLQAKIENLSRKIDFKIQDTEWMVDLVRTLERRKTKD